MGRKGQGGQRADARTKCTGPPPRRSTNIPARGRLLPLQDAHGVVRYLPSCVMIGLERSRWAFGPFSDDCTRSWCCSECKEPRADVCTPTSTPNPARVRPAPRQWARIGRVGSGGKRPRKKAQPRSAQAVTRQRWAEHLRDPPRARTGPQGPDAARAPAPSRTKQRGVCTAGSGRWNLSEVGCAFACFWC